MREIIVIESPNKIKKISAATGMKVYATVGHFMDLPKKDFGIDPEDGFKPKFVTDFKKRKKIEEIVAAAVGSKVYIATDPDREGYAIGMMVYEKIKSKAAEIYRAEVREITKTGVTRALTDAVRFEASNTGLYDAFLGRRLGDRVVGYKLSPLASRELKGRYSVGRVQSPAVRLVVEREREIRNFKPEPFWRVAIDCEPGSAGPQSKFRAWHTEKKFTDPLRAEAVFAAVQAVKTATVTGVTEKETERNPFPPFTTATLQMTASAKLGIAPEKCMYLAQDLFQAGLITYHRTDSVRVAPYINNAIRELIGRHYGNKYVPEKPRFYKSKNTQADAHEAIRPTFIHIPDEANINERIDKEGLGSDHSRLYGLICQRIIASQMASVKYLVKEADLTCANEPFRAIGRKLLFDGFHVLLKDDWDPDKEDDETIDQELPVLIVGETVVKVGEEKKEDQTKPPKRFSEASLIKQLEKLGIGRPSTYAMIIMTIKKRRYVTVVKKMLHATPAGECLVDYLSGRHTWVVDYDFTRDMEVYLDDVEDKKKEWRGFVADLYQKIMSYDAAINPYVPAGGYVKPETKMKDGKPTDKMLAFAEKISATIGTPLPDNYKDDGKRLSAWLKGNKKSFQAVAKDSPLSPKQLAVIEKYGDEAIKAKLAASDFSACRAWLNQHLKNRPRRRFFRKK